MDVKEKCMSVIKNFEGCKLKAYKDQKGLWTCGYGQIGPDIKEGTEWSIEQAEHALEIRVDSIISVLGRHLKTPLNDNQLAALTSLGYNIGIAALFGSTLFRLINERKYNEAANEFPKWCHIGNVTSPGLLKRRQAEQKLFLS